MSSKRRKEFPLSRFINDPHLMELRKNLSDVQSLMERGIVIEPDTGRTYFTGYSYKTLYDWDQYFEAIVQIYMGWPRTPSVTA